MSGIDPLQCEEGSRTIFVGFSVTPFSNIKTCIEMTVFGDKTFTLADIISTKIPIYVLSVFSLSLCIISLFLVYKQIKKIYGTRPVFKGEPLWMENPTLALYCQKHHIKVVVAKDYTGAPCIVGVKAPVIYISGDYALSLKECEAIVAHEAEHHRYKDTGVRWVLQCIGAVFWWIPTGRLLKRMEVGEEVSCDRGCLRHGIDPMDLASAIHVSAKCFLRTVERPLTSYFVKDTLLQRVSLLLHPIANKKRRLVVSVFAIGFGLVMIFLGRFWIF